MARPRDPNPAHPLVRLHRRGALQSQIVAELRARILVRRIREATRERWSVLADRVARELGGAIELAVPDGGSHAIGWLTCGVSGSAASEAAARLSVDVSPLSRFTLRAALPPALVLGYGAYPPAQLREGVARLARALDAISRPAGSRSRRRTDPSG